MNNANWGAGSPHGTPPPPHGYPPGPHGSPQPHGNPSGPQGYPPAPQGYPSGPQGYPPAPHGYAPGQYGYPPAPPPGKKPSGWMLPLFIGIPVLALIIGVSAYFISQPPTPTSPAPGASSTLSPRSTREPLADAVLLMETLPSAIGGWGYTPVSERQGFFDRPGDNYVVLATSVESTAQESAEILSDAVFVADNAIVCGKAFDGIMCLVETPHHGNINLVASEAKPGLAELQKLAIDLLTALR